MNIARTDFEDTRDYDRHSAEDRVGDMCLTWGNFARLAPQSPFHSNLIDRFMYLLQKKFPDVYAFRAEMGSAICKGTITSQRAADLADVARVRASRWIFFPCNPGWHWVLAAFDMVTGNCYYYDSYNSGGNHVVRAQRALEVMHLVLDQDGGEALVSPNTPQQYYRDGPGVDCGVFLCGFTHMLACGCDITYIDQKLINRYRLYIGACLHSHKLL